MTTKKTPINIKDMPKSFWQGFFFMRAEHTWKLIALLLTVAVIVLKGNKLLYD